MPSVLMQFRWPDIPRFAVITGKNGCGKTKLLKWMEAHYRDFGLTVLPIYDMTRDILAEGKTEEHSSYNFLVSIPCLAHYLLISSIQTSLVNVSKRLKLPNFKNYEWLIQKRSYSSIDKVSLPDFEKKCGQSIIQLYRKYIKALLRKRTADLKTCQYGQGMNKLKYPNIFLSMRGHDLESIFNKIWKKNNKNFRRRNEKRLQLSYTRRFGCHFSRNCV
jgi:hypothetical protein